MTDPDGRIFRWAMRSGVGVARRAVQGKLGALRETVAASSPPIGVVRMAAQLGLSMAPRRVRKLKPGSGRDESEPGVVRAGKADGGPADLARSEFSYPAVAPGNLGRVGRLATSRYERSSISRSDRPANRYGLPAGPDLERSRLGKAASGAAGLLSVAELAVLGRPLDGMRRIDGNPWLLARGISTLDRSVSGWARTIPRRMSGDDGAAISGAALGSGLPATTRVTTDAVLPSMTEMVTRHQAFPAASDIPGGSGYADSGAAARLSASAGGRHGAGNASMPSGEFDANSDEESFAGRLLERLTRDARRPDVGPSFFN